MRKIKKEKVGGHKQISFTCFKNYSVDEYEKTPCKVIFPNYEKYHNINKTFNDFFRKLIEVVNNTSNEWFDRRIAEKLSIRDKLFKKFKSSRLNIDWEIYKEARNDVQRTIKQKKKQYLEEKLSENIAKPKGLWQTLKPLGLPKGKNSPSNICLKNKNGLLFDSLSIAKTFQKYSSSLAENLALKLPKPPNNFGIQSVNSYCKKWDLKERLLFAKIESIKVFKILKTFGESKTSGIDDLSGIFLKTVPHY